MAGNGFSERRDMEALNAALERYERLLAKGTDGHVAAREASKLLTPGAAPLFVIADAVRVAIEHLQTAMARSSRSVRSRTLMLYGQLGNRGENRTVSQ